MLTHKQRADKVRTFIDKNKLFTVAVIAVIFFLLGNLVHNKIETYETSILPYEDCCTIFLPKHPVINPTTDKCEQYEKRFDYQSLIDECINNIETITNLNKNGSNLL